MRTTKSHQFAALFTAAAFLAAPALAQSDQQAVDQHMKTVRSKVVQKRDSALNVLLEMTDEQAKAFWPLQKAYDKELIALGKQERKLTVDFANVYKTLTADVAADISGRFFEIQKARLDLQQKYLKQISDEVSPVVAIQFIQLQRRFETELQMERMKYSPLAE